MKVVDTTLFDESGKVHAEKWLYEGSNLSKLERALDWAEKNPPKDNFDEFMVGLENNGNKGS